jgi:predicted dehydrogenase
MTDSNRRSFLKHTATASAGAAAWAWTGGIRAAGANQRLAVGVIGCGGQGRGLANAFAKLADIAYVCDPDESRRRQTQEQVRAKHAGSDLRRVLDDKAVDAVVVATPDHWHAPIAIMACEAGKHVYVEKPQSHSLRESRLLVDAARRNKVVVQHGTQSRSNALIAGAVQMLREGVIGDVLVAKAWNIQRRGNIGRAKPSDPPAGLDYDLWVGPAEWMPFQKNRFHYDWHWWYNFGTGDIGNDGTHEIDYARWGLGVEGLPTTATAAGGKYYFDDDQEFADTANCLFEWPGDGRVGKRKQLIFEMRLWDTCYPHNVDSGAEFYGTAGKLVLSKRGRIAVYGERNKRIEDAKPKDPPSLVGNHYADFLDAVRTGRKPNADVAIGHDSVALVHLANAALRAERTLRIDTDTEQVVGDEQANALLSRQYRQGGHWAVPRGV